MFENTIAVKQAGTQSVKRKCATHLICAHSKKSLSKFRVKREKTENVENSVLETSTKTMALSFMGLSLKMIFDGQEN